MIVLKLTALAFGAGTLFELFLSSDTGPDFILAILSCFS